MNKNEVTYTIVNPDRFRKVLTDGNIAVFDTVGKFQLKDGEIKFTIDEQLWDTIWYVVYHKLEPANLTQAKIHLLEGKKIIFKGSDKQKFGELYVAFEPSVIKTAFLNSRMLKAKPYIEFEVDPGFVKNLNRDTWKRLIDKDYTYGPM